MRLLDGLWIALRTYSVLPVPETDWQGAHMKTALCFLPVAGLVPAGGLLLLALGCSAAGAPAALFAAAAAVLPLLLTGGIHMDGFMDTADALASRQPRERKLEIMKDAHPGAFAVMWCAAYLLMSFGLYWALYASAALYAAAAGFVLSRALCALCAFTLPPARPGGMLGAFTAEGGGSLAKAVMGLLSLGWAAGMAVLLRWPGLCAVLAAGAAFLCYRRMAMDQFGGVTGDTSGYFIQICEIAALLGAWLGGLL